MSDEPKDKKQPFINPDVTERFKKKTQELTDAINQNIDPEKVTLAKKTAQSLAGKFWQGSKWLSSKAIETGQKTYEKHQELQEKHRAYQAALEELTLLRQNLYVNQLFDDYQGVANWESMNSPINIQRLYPHKEQIDGVLKAYQERSEELELIRKKAEEQERIEKELAQQKKLETERIAKEEAENERKRQKHLERKEAEERKKEKAKNIEKLAAKILVLTEFIEPRKLDDGWQHMEEAFNSPIKLSDGDAGGPILYFQELTERLNKLEASRIDWILSHWSLDILGKVKVRGYLCDEYYYVRQATENIDIEDIKRRRGDFNLNTYEDYVAMLYKIIEWLPFPSSNKDLVYNYLNIQFTDDVNDHYNILEKDLLKALAGKQRGYLDYLMVHTRTVIYGLFELGKLRKKHLISLDVPLQYFLNKTDLKSLEHLCVQREHNSQIDTEESFIEVSTVQLDKPKESFFQETGLNLSDVPDDELIMDKYCRAEFIPVLVKLCEILNVKDWKSDLHVPSKLKNYDLIKLINTINSSYKQAYLYLNEFSKDELEEIYQDINIHIMGLGVYRHHSQIECSENLFLLFECLDNEKHKKEVTELINLKLENNKFSDISLDTLKDALVDTSEPLESLERIKFSISNFISNIFANDKIDTSTNHEIWMLIVFYFCGNRNTEFAHPVETNKIFNDFYNSQKLKLSHHITSEKMETDPEIGFEYIISRNLNSLTSTECDIVRLFYYLCMTHGEAAQGTLAHNMIGLIFNNGDCEVESLGDKTKEFDENLCLNENEDKLNSGSAENSITIKQARINFLKKFFRRETPEKSLLVACSALDQVLADEEAKTNYHKLIKFEWPKVRMDLANL